MRADDTNTSAIRREISGTAADVRALRLALRAFRRMSSWRTRHAAWRWLGDRLADVARGDDTATAASTKGGQ